MHPVGFEPTISAGERPQTHALDRAATGTGTIYNYIPTINLVISVNRVQKMWWGWGRNEISSLPPPFLYSVHTND